jgi:hypothetical protein
MTDVMAKPTILALHGNTMNGTSMQRHLGPLSEALEAAGFELVFPDGSHAMSDPEVAAMQRFANQAYERMGEDAGESFTDGEFWDGAQHFSWFNPHTDEQTGKKTYRALEDSLQVAREAATGRDVRGILGFSEGCGAAALMTALAKQGELPFGDTLRFGIYLSGFRPFFDLPALDPWPVPAPFSSYVLMGTRDPIFPDGRKTLDELAAVFPEEGRTTRLVEGLGHRISRDDALVEEAAAFARRFA